VDSQTLGFLGLAVVLIGAIAMVTFSVIVMTRESRVTAEINRKNNKPVSNGYAGVAVIAVVVIFVLTIVLGLLPPLLRRG
jgi:NADH:ubiquinone oxidoreductase subunit 6 (subunit J)